GEISPLHPAGRIFAMFLIAFGVALGAFTATTIGQIVLEGQLTQIFGRKKMETRIKKLSGHYIIAGFGRVGRQVACEFANRNVPFLIVEKEPAAWTPKVSCSSKGKPPRKTLFAGPESTGPRP
ncbi:MAG: potassium channel protein, partial [candidate division Zixibacteria bacterium]|nr:potassium channel protein [candidate division Zixibacteria bacterium]